MPIGYRADYKDFDIAEIADYIARPLKTSGFGLADTRRSLRTVGGMLSDDDPLT